MGKGAHGSSFVVSLDETGCIVGNRRKDPPWLFDSMPFTSISPKGVLYY